MACAEVIAKFGGASVDALKAERATRIQALFRGRKQRALFKVMIKEKQVSPTNQYLYLLISTNVAYLSTYIELNMFSIVCSLPHRYDLMPG